MNYVNITIEEMRRHLRPSKGWAEVNVGREYVFDWRIPFDRSVVVRVYTGISKSTNTSRGNAKDAIRVCLVNVRLSRGLKKFPHVKRVEGWRENLKERVFDAVLAQKDHLHRVGYPPIYWPEKDPTKLPQPPDPT